MFVPDSAGVMILGGSVLFPQAMLPLFIFEPRYRTMLAQAIDSHRMFCIAMQKPNDSRETPLPVASLGLIRAAVKNPNGTSNLVLQGITRVRLGRVLRYKPYRVHEITPLVPEETESVAIDALRFRTLELVEARLRQGAPVAPELLQQLIKSGGGGTDPAAAATRGLKGISNSGYLADLVSLLLIANPLARQVILQSIPVADRLRHLIHFLQTDLAEQPADGPA